MQNTYLTSHFPLFSILIFSTSFALYSQAWAIEHLHQLGIYSGMMEFFSEIGIQLTLFTVFILFYFMVFAALKLVSDTVIQLSLLFFSSDEEGSVLNKIRAGSWIYLLASLISLLFFQQFSMIVLIFLLATGVYFMYFIYKVMDSLTPVGMIGMVVFHIAFWFTFVIIVSYPLLRLYNSFMASLTV